MKNEPMAGQYSIFDMMPSESKPYEYHFKRYLGQKVKFSTGMISLENKTYSIKEIQNYYTIVVDDKGEEFVGTPTTIYPEREDEFNDRIT